MTDVKSELSQNEIQTLVRAGIIPDGTPSAQIAVFAMACKLHNLSPFKKEIYLVKYNTKNGPQYHCIVGIDGLRTKAARTGQFAGRDDSKFDIRPDGSFKTAAELREKRTLPVTCTVTVYRMIGGTRCPFTKTVVFSEYYPAVADPNPNRPDYSKAAMMPFNMIEKCAEAAVLRMAFSDEVGGLYIDEERAAFEDTTQQAAEIAPSVAINLEELKDRIAGIFSIEGLTELYNSNKGHREYAQLFTERKNEIIALISNGQIRQK